MSLGGFAQGLATSFQRAEDRYQDKKMREEARAEARLARASAQAFQEKMYTRRQKDDYMKDVMSYQSELKAIFGTDKEGMQMVAAVMPMGQYGVEMAKNYQKVANERGFSKEEFKGMFEIMYPDGIDSETYGDVNLNNIAKGMEQYRFAKEGDPRDPVTDLGFKFKPLQKKRQKFTELAKGTTEGTIIMGQAYLNDLLIEKSRGKKNADLDKDIEETKKFVEKFEAIQQKEQEAALALATAKSTKSGNEAKAGLLNFLEGSMNSIAAKSVEPIYQEKLENKIIFKLKGTYTPKLFGDLKTAEALARTKLDNLTKSETFNNITYRNTAISATNTEIILPQQQVYQRLLEQAEDSFSPDSQKGKLQISGSLNTAISQAPVSLQSTGKLPIVNYVNFDGKSPAEYKKYLKTILKKNEFYAVPNFRTDDTGKLVVDYSKKPVFAMHRGFVTDGKEDESNPLGLLVQRMPKFIPSLAIAEE